MAHVRLDRYTAEQQAEIEAASSASESESAAEGAETDRDPDETRRAECLATFFEEPHNSEHSSRPVPFDSQTRADSSCMSSMSGRRRDPTHASIRPALNRVTLAGRHLAPSAVAAVRAQTLKRVTSADSSAADNEPVRPSSRTKFSVPTADTFLPLPFQNVEPAAGLLEVNAGAGNGTLDSPPEPEPAPEPEPQPTAYELALTAGTEAHQQAVARAEKRAHRRWKASTDCAAMMAGLTDELLWRIIERLNDRDCAALELTCHRLRRVVAIRKELQAEDRRLKTWMMQARPTAEWSATPLEVLAMVFSHFTRSERYELLCLERRCLPILLASLQKHVRLAGPDFDAYEKLTARNAVAAVRCRTLELAFYHRANTEGPLAAFILSRCAQLVNLTIRSPPALCIDLCMRHALQIPTLRRLSVRSGGSGVADILRASVSADANLDSPLISSNLEEISLGGGSTYDDASSSRSDTPFNDDGPFRWLASELEILWPAGLQALTLKQITFSDSTSFVRLVQNLPPLRSLSLIHLFLVTPADYKKCISVHNSTLRHFAFDLDYASAARYDGLLDDVLQELSHIEALFLGSSSPSAFPLKSDSLRRLPATLVALELQAATPATVDPFAIGTALFITPSLRCATVQIGGLRPEDQANLNAALAARSLSPFADWVPTHGLARI